MIALGSFNRINSIPHLYQPLFSWTIFAPRIYEPLSELHLTSSSPSRPTRARRQRTQASTKYTKPFSYNKNVQDSLAPAVRNLRFAVHPEPTPRTSTDCYIQQHGEPRAEHTTKANSKGARTVKYGIARVHYHTYTSVILVILRLGLHVGREKGFLHCWCGGMLCPGCPGCV